MNIKIHDLRLSFIWVETLLDLFNDATPSGAPLSFIGNRPSYQSHFEKVSSGAMGPEGIQLPWPRPSGELFWTYYFGGRKPGSVMGVQAWKSLVPFRKKIPVMVDANWLLGHIMLEGFFYPHGIALIITSYCKDILSLEEAVEKAFEIRRNGKYNVRWNDGNKIKSQSINKLAEDGLTYVRNLILGPSADPGDTPVTPFSVVTVIKGSGVDPMTPTPDGGSSHRALEAITEWRPSWPYDTLPSLDRASLQIRTAPASHLHYSGKRGRAVWFPGLFGQKGGAVRSLGCYHRNLVFSTLQVESFSQFMIKTAKYLDQQLQMSATHQECARRAAGILGRLYGGHFSTYRSWSPKYHIDQNNYSDRINRVRDFFNLPPL
jgi:hypothetical protein